MSTGIDSATVECSIAQLKTFLRCMPEGMSVMVYGPPGMGKTQLTEQVAQERDAHYRVFLSCTMDPTDVVGVPHPVDGVTQFLPPADFMELTDEAEYKGPLVVCFDDLPASDDRVFAAMFRIFQQREVAGHKIRKNVLLIGTGNRSQDKAGARDLPTALSNRFVNFTIRPSDDEWRSWAITNRIEPTIVGFIGAQPQMLNQFDPSKNVVAFATPRTVEMASHVQKRIGLDDANSALLFMGVAGCCGVAWANSYQAFLKNSIKLIPPQEIFNDPKGCRVPKESEIDIAHATISALSYALIENPTRKKCKAAARYALRQKFEEFGVCIFKDMMQGIMLNPGISTEDVAKYSTLPEWKEMGDKWNDVLRSASN